MLRVGDHTARVVCSRGAHIPSASSAPCALTKMRRACLGCRLTSATRVAMWIFIARLCKTLVDDRASDMASSDTRAWGAVSMRAVRESLAPKLSGRRWRRRAVAPCSLRPSELLRAFFAAGLCFIAGRGPRRRSPYAAQRPRLAALAGAAPPVPGRDLAAGARRRTVLRLRLPGHRPAAATARSTPSSRPGTSARCSSRSASPPGVTVPRRGRWRADRRPVWCCSPLALRGMRAATRCSTPRGRCAGIRPRPRASASARCSGVLMARGTSVAARQPARRAPRAQPRRLAGHGDHRHAAHVLPLAHPDTAALPAPAAPHLRPVAARACALLAIGAAFTSHAVAGRRLDRRCSLAAALLCRQPARLAAHRAIRPLALPARLLALAQAFLARRAARSRWPPRCEVGRRPVPSAAPGGSALAVLLLAGWIGLTVTGSLLHLLAILARDQAASRSRCPDHSPTLRPCADRNRRRRCSGAHALITPRPQTRSATRQRPSPSRWAACLHSVSSHSHCAHYVAHRHEAPPRTHPTLTRSPPRARDRKASGNRNRPDRGRHRPGISHPLEHRGEVALPRRGGASAPGIRGPR